MPGWLFGRAVAEHDAWARAGYHGVRVAALRAGTPGAGAGRAGLEEEEVWARWNPEHRRQEVWRAPVAEAVGHALAPLARRSFRRTLWCIEYAALHSYTTLVLIVAPVLSAVP